jgi:hypothetical protein
VKPLGDVLSLCTPVSFAGSDDDGGDQRTFAASGASN